MPKLTGFFEFAVLAIFACGLGAAAFAVLRHGGAF